MTSDKAPGKTDTWEINSTRCLGDFNMSLRLSTPSLCIMNLKLTISALLFKVFPRSSNWTFMPLHSLFKEIMQINPICRLIVVKLYVYFIKCEYFCLFVNCLCDCRKHNRSKVIYLLNQNSEYIFQCKITICEFDSLERLVGCNIWFATQGSLKIHNIYTKNNSREGSNTVAKKAYL